ncbi:MAG: hypothetical protein DCF25_13960 [Leptolyngbya foveolarum]|jgi:predicted nucleotidyltransferase|uniref:Polymerase nucleotidyl transferase domain-containing protein n=1 Tax=Leptolyngbya foveolarum TaxID=47253 RepID=A0A2W4VZ97_9CYAN|nr:MAG: hypothetical protein DCF25_13960 [Leptolyngbya foveolarum]
MDRVIVEATLSKDGAVVLNELPFEPGDTVQITVVKQVCDREPFLSADKPLDWKNANPRYWIREATERIVEKFQPKKLILFGSHATGTATIHSDIDLLVVFETIENKRKRISDIRKLLSDFPIAKDIIVATPEDIEKYSQLLGTVIRPAIQEGRTLYEQR